VPSSSEHLISDALGFLDARSDELVAFARELVATPSPVPPGDERAVVELLSQRLAHLGLPRGDVLAKRPERPNLQVTLPAARAGKRLVLSGHTDTKPIGDQTKWRTDPLDPVVRDGILYGLGSSDMKAAVAAMVYAAAAIAPALPALAGQLGLVFTADEEAGSAWGAHYLAQEVGIQADAILIGEPQGIQDPFDNFPLVSRGIAAFKVKVYGTQSHSSVSDRLPNVHACEKAAQTLLAFRKRFKVRFPQHPLCPYGPTLNVGVMMSGGVNYGVIPGYAEFGSEVRLIPGMDRETFREDVERLLADLRREDPQLEVAFEWAPPPLDWLPATEVMATEPLVEAVARAAEQVLGRRPPLSYFPGGTDAVAFHGTAGIPTLPGFGPGILPPCHGPNEWVSLQALQQSAQIYALTALTYLAPE